MSTSRCGRCTNCRKLEAAKKSVMAAVNPPFSHADDGVVAVWNRSVEDYPCTGRLCGKCREPKADVEDRYSFTVFAGYLCEDCARSGFRDQCGLTDDGQGNPYDLDEPLEEPE